MPLPLKVGDFSAWDVKHEQFIDIKAQEFELEHSLYAVSKWEAKNKKRFFSKNEKTPEEMLDYIKCMIITPGVDPDVVNALNKDQIQQIANYMSDPMTGTTFSERSNGGGKGHQRSGEELSSELIYYYMTQVPLPMECDRWHLSRLMTLLRVAAEKSKKPEKMPKGKQLAQQRALNKARHAKAGRK